MKKFLHYFALLAALMMPTAASADYVQLADGVYQDGTTLYISSEVTSLGSLQLNPSVIYCYATIPPALASDTFTGYDAVVHVPATGMVSYFTALYWYNFNNITADAIEPLSVTISNEIAEMEAGSNMLLSATVTPSTTTPGTIYWSSTDTSVATVVDGMVTAVGAGECDIIAACVDKQAICHLTVSQSVTLTLDKHEVRLLPNHTVTLTATCSPATTDLVVSSSNTEVAIPRYVNGVIMVVGVGEGTAIITVSTTDETCQPDYCEVTVYTEMGDVNSDGFVDVGDVTILIDHVLGNGVEGLNFAKADTNNDGQLDVADVTLLLNYILSGSWPWDVLQTETFTVNGVSFKMVTVDGGTFTMGATDEQISEAYDDESPAHKVTLSSYAIGETEVTQALWEAVMGDNPSYFSRANGYDENLNRPVERVSWNACQEFIAKLNEMTGKSFRLPTEAEWEYAARGGNKSQGYKYSGGNAIDDVAWYNENSYANGSSDPNYGTHTVGTKAPNELGLYDMSGNVWEFCQDWFGSYSSEAQTDPVGPASGTDRVGRGGCWRVKANNCRVSYRGYSSPNGISYLLGLRLAL